MKTHLLIAALTLWSVVVAQGAPSLTQSEVYVSGKDGYNTFCIPAIETAADGSLIAFAEARKYNATCSEIAVLKDNSVGMLWERGIERSYQFITFTRVNREWLEAGPWHFPNFTACYQPWPVSATRAMGTTQE